MKSDEDIRIENLVRAISAAMDKQEALTEEDLDSLVHDCSSERASEVNNSGRAAQLEYLLRAGWSSEDILSRLDFEDTIKSYDPLLPPGNYGAFVLCDSGTWSQPVYRVDEPISEHDLRKKIEAAAGGFTVYGLQEDTEIEQELVLVFGAA